MLDKITGQSKLLEKAINATWLRNEAISQNIANVDTPGYKRKTVKFEEYLKNATNSSFVGRRTNSRHIPIGASSIDTVKPKIVEDYSNTSMRLDGNNVDIENEMAALAKNTIQYNALITRLNSEFSKLRNAINEGRR